MMKYSRFAGEFFSLCGRWFQLMKQMYSRVLINEDGVSFGSALEKAWRDCELQERHFVSPLVITAAEGRRPAQGGMVIPPTGQGLSRRQARTQARNAQYNNNAYNPQQGAPPKGRGRGFGGGPPGTGGGGKKGGKGRMGLPWVAGTR